MVNCAVWQQGAASETTHLGLVAHSGHAAVVHKGEGALAVVAGDELHGDTDAVDVQVARATRHLRRKGRKT